MVPGNHEAGTPRQIARIAIAFLWVWVLTFWWFYQYLFFLYYDPASWRDSFFAAGAVLGRIDSLWLISFLPAFAFGIAWYAFSYPRRSAYPSTWRRYGEHLRRVQVLGCLCTAICLNVFVWRITPIPAILGSASDRVSPALHRLYRFDPNTWGSSEGFFERLVIVGALGAGVVFFQAREVVRRSGGKTGPLASFAAVVLVVGLAVPALGLYKHLPLPFPRTILELSEGPPEARAILSSRPSDTDEAARLVATYLRTHDEKGDPVALSDSGLVQRRPREGACDTCLLPLTILATPTGIPVDLGSGRPSMNEPELVVEIPLSGDVARVYGGDRSFQSVPLENLRSLGIHDDWLVMKIDAEVKFRAVAALLADLREMGVRRVSLAALPRGWSRPPGDVPTLRIGKGVEARVLELEPSSGEESRDVVIVRKYVPPGRREARRACHGSGLFELVWQSHAWRVPPPGSLPDSIDVTPAWKADRYQDFIVRLDRAIAGGARKLYVSQPPDDTESEVRED